VPTAAAAVLPVLEGVLWRPTTLTHKLSTAFIKKGGCLRSGSHCLMLWSECSQPTVAVAVLCRPDGADAGDALGSSCKSMQKGVFATLYTLTKNKSMDTSLRVAALRIVLEFLQVCADRQAVLQGFASHVGLNFAKNVACTEHLCFQE
jgi:hypothetical protein